MSNRTLVTKAWLTSFGDFLTLLLCVIIASHGGGKSDVTTGNNERKEVVDKDNTIIGASGITFASSKLLAMVRADFFDNAEGTAAEHNQIVDIAKALPVGGTIEVELCAPTPEAMLQRAEILQGIFSKQRVRMFATSVCNALSQGELPIDVVASIKQV